MEQLEIWASPEPTVARISASCVRDQLAETGHERRESDIDRLASLGIRATRYPVLWEKIAPHDPERRDFRWSDRRLDLLRAANIEPIVTLLHHGSGPGYTNLVDPAFPRLFAAYADAVVRRYPWVRRWTPINEPLTTARFSTLYGTWYPNTRFDHVAFAHAIVYEALGIAGAMRAIRAVNPSAELILTEDLQGFTAADREIAEYVEHKRHRSFLSAELLMGRVVAGHPLYAYLTQAGNVRDTLLRQLSHEPCPPQVMGYNYYPNSERWLASEGHGRHHNLPLVDIDPAALDPRTLLRAAWQRLELPMVLSEVHVIGSDDERVRWLLQRHADAVELRSQGVPIHAIGAWAAFGMIDWTSLLCQRRGHVEDGVFAFASGNAEPRRTRVADALAVLCTGRIPEMPSALGWWERDRNVEVA